MRQERKRFSASRKFIAAAALGIGLAASANTASAALVTATLDGTYGGVVDRIIEDSTTGTQEWTSISASILTFTRTGGDYPSTLLPGLDGTFYAICIEPQQTISLGSNYTFEAVALENAPNNISGMGAKRAALVSQLLYGVQMLNDGIPERALEASALQIALWEIIRESEVDLDNPDFNVDDGLTRFRNASHPDTLALANEWLEEFVNSEYPYSRLDNIIALTNPDSQDLLAFFYRPSNPVPEPGTLALLGIGLAGIGRVLRRRR